MRGRIQVSAIFCLALTAFIGCGSDELEGRWEGYQTIHQGGNEPYSVPVVLDISLLEDDEEIEAQWLSSDGGGHGTLHGSWDDDKIQDATLSIDVSQEQIIEPQKQGPAPQDVTTSTDAKERNYVARGSCMASFVGQLTVSKDRKRIRGTLNYDTSNPVCASSVSARYIEVVKKADKEED